MKKVISLFIILISCLFITGCGNEEVDEKVPVANKSSILDKIDEAGSGKLKCSREAFASEGIDVELTNEIEYENGYIMILHSIDKVISDNKESLDQYEKAYRSIAKNYEGLKYYFRNFDPTHKRFDEIYEKLGYIDIQNLAKRMKAELLMFTGLMDTICPPSTQFAMYNKVNSKKNVIFYPEYGHEQLKGVSDIIFEFLSDL